MKEKLVTRCSFADAWDHCQGERYPMCEIGYIRAYFKDGRWWNNFNPIHWELQTVELKRDFERVYFDFTREFPTLDAVIRYVDHEAERKEDPDEGYAYLETAFGLYQFRMITRKGDYNLYLTCLSRAAYEQQMLQPSKENHQSRRINQNTSLEPHFYEAAQELVDDIHHSKGQLRTIYRARLDGMLTALHALTGEIWTIAAEPYPEKIVVYIRNEADDERVIPSVLIL